MSTDELIANLPGEELIREGLADIRSGRVTIASCLAAIAWPRLKRAGILDELPTIFSEQEELRLYRLLRESGGDAYSNYNALLRRLVSFEQALDHRCRRYREPSASTPADSN